MENKECIVHIGMHKTGSSSIQHSLYRMTESETFCYFDLESPNHSGRIFSMFSKTKMSHAHKKLNRTENDIVNFNLETKNMLISNIKKCNKDVMIISGEAISILSKNELEDFRDFLYQYFQKITIVGYVRTVKSYIESSFQQIVKGGVGHFIVANLYPDYRDRFEKFDLVFGPENVKLWKFDPKSFPNGNVVMDFCNRLKITIKSEQTVRVNESISKEALSLLYIYRKYGAGYGIGTNVIRENNMLITSLKDIGKTKIKFSPSLIKPLIENNQEDFLWMEKRLGEKLTENMSLGVDDIMNEEDLLRVDKESFQVLSDMIKDNSFPKDTRKYGVKEVADLIQALRMKLSKNTINNNTKGNDEMKLKLIELAQKVQKENTEQLGKMNEKKIAMIIRKTLEQIKKEIVNTDGEKIIIQGFGNFSIRMIEKEEDGKKVMHKRMIFRPAKDIKVSKK